MGQSETLRFTGWFSLIIWDERKNRAFLLGNLLLERNWN